MVFKDIGVVVADWDEYRPLLNKIPDAVSVKTPFKSAVKFSLGGANITVINSGIGKVNAASAAMYLACGGCSILLNYGLSGGIKGVMRGDYILPQKFLEHDFDLSPLGYAPCEKPGQAYIYSANEQILDKICAQGIAKRGGIAVCGDRFISDGKTRQYLIENFSATSCDMETAAIASVCAQTNLPFVSLRRISDDAGNTAADSYGDMNKNEGLSLSDVFIKCLKIICEA